MNRPTAQPDGLSPAEVAERVAAGRVNRPPRDGWRAYADIARRNTLTLYNALVVPAAVGLFLLADYRAAWAVSAMAVANVALGLAHELRAKRHLDRLSVLGEARVRVRRGGTEVPLPAGDVVADDVVLLAAGDTVVADGAVVAADFLELDEAPPHRRVGPGSEGGRRPGQVRERLRRRRRGVPGRASGGRGVRPPGGRRGAAVPARPPGRRKRPSTAWCGA